MESSQTHTEPIILGGTLVAGAIKRDIHNQIENLVNTHHKRPELSVILVGNDPASVRYVDRKKHACEEVGIVSHVDTYSRDVSEVEILAKIDSLNTNPAINGILIQLPLPPSFTTRKILDRVSPEKDVDGFTTVNGGWLFYDHADMIPCTPLGIITLLKAYTIPLEGRHVVIIGRGQTVGKPLASLFLSENCTVTTCHSKTPDFSQYTRLADIIVSATGQPLILKSHHVKKGVVVVDVGNHRMPDGKLCGEVDYDSVSKIASAITPVPGGVGPMTIAMLLQNTLKSFRNTI